MSGEHYLATYNVPLVGDVDLEGIIDRAPRDFTIKGMFFKRYVHTLPWDEVSRDLTRPPPNGRYGAFEPYPFVDYLRVFGRAAHLRFPGATREAFRLLARGEVEVFAESTFGKVTLSLIDDPKRALSQFPRVLSTLSRGFACEARDLSEAKTEIYFPAYAGVVEIVLGLLEGIVSIFEQVAEIEVTRDESRVTYLVSLTGKT